MQHVSRSSEHIATQKASSWMDDSVKEHLLEQDETGIFESPRGRRANAPWLCLCLCLCLLLNLLLATALLLKTPSDRQCSERLSVWSPLNEVVEYESRDFDNAFAHDTIYRGPPSIELEEAWDDLWFYDGFRIPADKLSQLNRTVDLGQGRSLKPVEDDIGGYHGMIEVFHQLHCLNMVRQYTWHDWYLRHDDLVRTPADIVGDPVGVRMHVDHCIETLRLSLMCQADTTPQLVMLDPAAPLGSRADFNVHHKCRQFQPIQEWAKANQLQDPRKPGRWDPIVGK